MTTLAYVIAVGFALFGLVFFASLFFAGASDQKVYITPEVSRLEAFRSLLEKAQREVDAINGVRR